MVIHACLWRKTSLGNVERNAWCWDGVLLSYTRWSGQTSLLRLPKEVRELAMWISEGGAFQIEGRETQRT